MSDNSIPKCAIQWKTKALAHIFVSVPFNGIASSNLVNWSTMHGNEIGVAL